MTDSARKRAARSANRSHVDPAALKARNREIARKVIRDGIRYSDIAREHHLTRERVRQIVVQSNPDAYRKDRRAWKERIYTARYGRCPRCRMAKHGKDLKQKRLYRLVDPKHRYCRACEMEEYKREITLSCRCGREKKISWGRLLYLKSQGTYVRTRVSAQGNTGGYVCRPCHWSGFGKKKGRSITLTCRCGVERRLPLSTLLNLKARGGFKTARPSADGKTGKYICLACHIIALNKALHGAGKPGRKRMNYE